ncbi:MAG: 5-dehydro-4-deoxy-D-glucuronate isomerase [Candidatus Ratteibacteria bacterium]|nr:5-dehydro-4-deoxy-D-glucuronate isomerase [Candidatus Ratteibacteria bacterium]
MEIRESSNSKDAKHYTTERLREEFLVEDLFISGKIKRVYSQIDRIIVMGIVPAGGAIELGQNLDIMHNLGTDYFLERRELGVINMGEKGSITVDGKKYEMNSRDGLYAGKGTKEVLFESEDLNKPAKFYALSAPAHKTYETTHIDISKANKVDMGSDGNCNKRVINQYIQPGVVESCQLCMGLTQMAPGNVWNTMPCHTHQRRMEVYAYFDLPEDAMVFHYIGEPCETRHIIMKNEQAAITPSWSIHSGCGTCAYSFIWGMVGENQTFTDMDAVELKEMK